VLLLGERNKVFELAQKHLAFPRRSGDNTQELSDYPRPPLPAIKKAACDSLDSATCTCGRPNGRTSRSMLPG